MDARTRWIIGLLICLVIGLGIALIVVAGDDSNDNGRRSTTVNPSTTGLTEPTTTAAPTTSTTTPSGGTPVPGGTTTSPNGEGGL